MIKHRSFEFIGVPLCRSWWRFLFNKWKGQRGWIPNGVKHWYYLWHGTSTCLSSPQWRRRMQRSTEAEFLIWCHEVKNIWNRSRNLTDSSGSLSSQMRCAHPKNGRGQNTFLSVQHTLSQSRRLRELLFPVLRLEPRQAILFHQTPPSRY